MAETNHLGIDEDQAARIVREALKDASRDMELLAQRYLAQGRADDFERIQGQIASALEDLAREYGIRLTNTHWGQMIIQSAKLGVASVPGAAFVLSKTQINAALYNAQVKIKGLVADGAAIVNETVAGAMIRGDSLRDISQAIQERVKIEGGLINEAHADMIARNELFSVYRQTSKGAADATGVELFQMRGPMDSRTTAICREHLGQVKTAAEWIAIRPLVFIYGLHYRCRHSWDPVRDAQSPAVLRFMQWAEQQRARLKAAA